MPLRQQKSSEDGVNEQVKVAAVLYEEDVRQLQAVQERLAATKAAEEMGIPAAYMERAAVTIAARQAGTAERRKRRGATGIAAIVAAAAASGVWIQFHRHINSPLPLVYDFAATGQGQWHLDGLGPSHPDAQVSLSFPEEQGHPVALIKVAGFYPYQSDYAVDLDTNQIPRPLTGYRTVRFRVRGRGLSQIRLFLQNGADRWCSPFVTAAGDWHEVQLPLSRFLHQRISPQYNPQDRPYVAPRSIGMISFKLGRDANPQDEHGEVAVSGLRFE